MIIRKKRRAGDPLKGVPPQKPWKILVVDDEPDVHAVTNLALRNVTFEERPLEFVDAYDGREALEKLRADPDIAVVLLDVVMTSEDDGLQVCQQIREELGNDRVRIVLRTGQPGMAPERTVIEKYDIDDYREKSDLPNEKLYTCVRMALKSFRDLSRLGELYEETLSLQRATEKVMNHLSHELRTPLAIARAVLAALEREETPAVRDDLIARGQRNLERLMELHQEIRQIFQGTQWRKGDVDPLFLYHRLVARLVDDLAANPEIAMEILRLKEREVAELLEGPDQDEPKEPVDLSESVPLWILSQRPLHEARTFRVETRIAPESLVEARPRFLEQAFVALWRNAVENTPDGGLIEVSVRRTDPSGVRITVADRGVGITPENQRYLFSGFYHTQSTDLYSSRRPYAFDAGGKGLDLLRLKVWAQRFGWRVDFRSERCQYIPEERDQCPGKIADCGHCDGASACDRSGGSEFSIFIPAVAEVAAA